MTFFPISFIFLKFEKQKELLEAKMKEGKKIHETDTAKINSEIDSLANDNSRVQKKIDQRTSLLDQFEKVEMDEMTEKELQYTASIYLEDLSV